MKTMNEPLCVDCGYWRDYSDPIEMQEHPDYDGHCWLKGIMTLNIKEWRGSPCGWSVLLKGGLSSQIFAKMKMAQNISKLLMVVFFRQTHKAIYGKPTGRRENEL